MGHTKSVLDQLVTELSATLDHAEILVELESALGYLEAARARLLAEFTAAGECHSTEYPSATAFLVDRCRIAPGRASRLVAVARALSEMPETEAAWSDGRLSSDQVRVLIRAHDTDPPTFAGHESTLVDISSELGIVDSTRAMEYWREAANPERIELEASELHARRRVHLSQTLEGMWRLDGWLDPLSGELVRTALDAATPPPDPTETRSPAQRRADALTDLSRQALDYGEVPDQGGEKPHLVVLVGAERLHHQRRGPAESVSGTVFPQSTIELLACDCSVSRVVYRGAAQPIDLGRKTRVIPPHLRRAVIARDRHCRHPGCFRPAKWCDIDHIVSWLDGGETFLDNLQLLCRYHHRLKHGGGPFVQGPKQPTVAYAINCPLRV